MKVINELGYGCLIVFQQIYNWRINLLKIFLLGMSIGIVSLIIFGADKNFQVGIITLGVGWIIFTWALAFGTLFLLAFIRQIAYPTEKDRLLVILKQAINQNERYLDWVSLYSELSKTPNSNARAAFLYLAMNDLLEELVREGKISRSPSCAILEKPAGTDWGLEPDEWLYFIVENCDLKERGDNNER